MAASEARFRTMADSAPVLIWLSGPDKKYTWFNRRWQDFTGRTLEQKPGEDWAECVHPDDLKTCMDTYADHFDRHQRCTLEYRLKRHDGKYRWVTDTGIPLFDPEGQLTGYIGSCIDITEHKDYESRLELSSRVFTDAREAIAITDEKGLVLEVNQTYCRLTGHGEPEICGRLLGLLRSEQHPPEFFTALWHDLETKGHWYGEIWDQRKNGEAFAALVSISAVCDTRHRIQNYVVLFSDITRIKDHQRQLEHAAHYDALTLLPNRALLADRLGQAMSQCQRRGTSLAVIYVDLDGFKAVNDQYGHDAGDQLLIELSGRMLETLRDGDTLARMGGDEFVAVVTDLTDLEDCRPILTRLRTAAAHPVPIGTSTLQVSASLGVTYFPRDNVDADQLLRHADQAMYIAKQIGRNCHHVFDIDQDASVKTLNESLDRIRSALNQGELTVYYQPKINLRTRQLIGAEALIRWQHPELGLRMPRTFLPLIENHPLGLEVDEWVIETVLLQLSEWQRAGLALSVSVNIGAQHLQGSAFVSRLEQMLACHPGLPPHSLELEILESSALKELDHVASIMRSCRSMAVRFALDDFGTGYSSLTYLKKLPADVLKIDQSFVRDMLEDPDDMTIVKGVVGLARAFHREVIAEGVETPEHCSRLLELGCELAQGYVIARPMPAEEFVAWARSWDSESGVLRQGEIGF